MKITAMLTQVELQAMVIRELGDDLPCDTAVNDDVSFSRDENGFFVATLVVEINQGEQR